MLHQFLLAERASVLTLCKRKLLKINDANASSEEMERGLPVFYNELISVLRAYDEESEKAGDRLSESLHRDSAERFGKESLRLGYTAYQVVHGYGALFEAITEYLEDRHELVSAREFNRLNCCLDIAIAISMTEFSRGQHDSIARDEARRLGYLAHEMRNTLDNATVALQILKSGVGGLAGSSSRILEDALNRMGDIIDRSLLEVRLLGEPNLASGRYKVIDIVDTVEASARPEIDAKSLDFYTEIDPVLVVEVDHHLFVSALLNLVQNAVKFSKAGRRVSIRAKAVSSRVLIEIEDCCGGLSPGKIEELFHPYAQKEIAGPIVGFGLSIARRAILFNRGEVSARDIPGEGCVFSISLPRAPANLLQTGQLPISMKLKEFDKNMMQ